MQVIARSLAVVLVLAGGARANPAESENESISIGTSAERPPDLDLRLTLSMFLYRETGADAAPLVPDGAPVENASSVRRYFGDLRTELTSDRLAFDGRVRQTGTVRAQSGAVGGDEYELRTLAYKLGGADTSFTLGRQYIDALGATKIDGVALGRRVWKKTVKATLFGGLLPMLGSRSVDTDYLRVRSEDGTPGARLLPVAGGAGLSYATPSKHGDLGIAGVYVGQEVPGAGALERSRVLATSSGYWRFGAPLDIYHFVMADVAGNAGANLTNANVGIDVRPAPELQLTASLLHVSADLLQVAERNALSDPDPSAIGVVQNDIALVRISQDVARLAASLSLAQQRFEVSASGGVRRRAGITLQLADGSGTFAFPEARSAEATLQILDRRSLGGVRLALAGTLFYPLGDDAQGRARGAIVRLAGRRAFARERGEIEVDVMGESLRDASGGDGMCVDSLNPLTCYGTAHTIAAQAGALATWRIGREWLLLADAHGGYQDVDSSSLMGRIAWPRVLSLTTFIRVQWRYR